MLKREELVELVDQICEEEGYEDSPAYDLMEGMDEEMIRKTLADYNNVSNDEEK